MAVGGAGLGGVGVIAGLRVETKIFCCVKRTFNPVVRAFVGGIFISHCLTVRGLGAGRQSITGCKSGAAQDAPKNILFHQTSPVKTNT